MTVPFWCVLFVLVVPFVLSLVNDIMRLREFGRYENNYPREQSASLSGVGARIWAAQQNAWEALAMFAPSVIIADLAGADALLSTYAALLFCVARVLHALFYALNWSTLRSSIYFVALGSCFWLFWLAANGSSTS